MCPEDVTSQLEEEDESVDAGAVLLDDDSPSYQDVSPPMYQRRSPPHRSVSESELTRVRCLKAPHTEQALASVFNTEMHGNPLYASAVHTHK